MVTLERATVGAAVAGGLLDATRRCRVAIDSTGYALTRCSQYYRNRRGARDHRGFGKLTTCIDTRTHFILATLATKGPSYDAPLFAPVLRRAAAHLTAAGARVGLVLADAGYDAEAHHTLSRTRGTGARIPVNRRGSPHVRTPQRAAMAHRLATDARVQRQYHQRWQIESSYSRTKRRTGAALAARRDGAQRAELRLRALVHNLLILHRPARLSTEHSHF